MNYIFLIAIFITGLSGLAAQVLLLRELLISFFGNELTLGIILANWLISEAAGVFLIGKCIDRIKNKINLFVSLQIIFSLGLFFSIYLARTFKALIGVGFDEAVGLAVIFYSSLLIIFPVAFCHSALFSVGCKIQDINSARSIGKVYAWETIGTLAGSIILTLFLIPRLHTFQIVFLIAMSNFVIAFLLLKNSPSLNLKYSIIIILFFGVYLFMSAGLNSLQNISIKRQWGNAEILDYRNSIYGNIVVTKNKEQYTFFYNGIPTVTTPYPDRQFVEDFGNLPLLFHPAPKDALIIGGGAGGLINQILKHPLKSLDYAELDPLLIKMLNRYKIALIESELNDARVHIKSVDARFYLLNTPHKYDIILIGLSRPADLSTNRLFSKEFFSLAKKKLKFKGTLSFWLPGSFSYLSEELKGLNGCILNALKDAYNYVRIIPGDYNIFLASDAKDILEITPALITEKLRQRNITNTVLLPDYLNYRLSPELINWFDSSMQSATKKINSDFKPIALFETLAIWNKQFSKKLTFFYESMQNLDLIKISFLLSILTILLSLIIFKKPVLAKASVVYCIFGTGFYGMLSSLILIFAFQVFYGYLYYIIGLLIGLFMAGAASGSIFMNGRIEKLRRGLNLFLGLEILIAVFAYIMAVIMTEFLQPGHCSALIFLLLFFISGFLLGLEFPLAAKIYLKDKNKVGETSGILYGADLLGGWLAGILGGIIFLPILGLFNTCMVIVLFKLSGILLFLLTRNNLKIQV